VWFVKVGDWVTWSSQSAGIRTTKTGQIRRVLRPGERPHWRGTGASRNHQSYIVSVGGRLYWPRVTQLVSVDQPTEGADS
jgi:hypothetical protein